MLLSGRLKLKSRFFLVFVALALAVIVYYSGTDAVLSGGIHSLGVFGAAVAGAFYTFGFTTPTAFIIILEMMEMNSYVMVALAASITAATVDAVFFMAVREQLEKSAAELMMSIHAKVGRHSTAFSAIGFFLFGSPSRTSLGWSLWR